jgi:Tfp pilus assembly protein PilN
VIKINLLKSFGAGTSESIQMAEDLNNVKSSFFKNVLVMCLGVAALYGYEFVTIPELQAQLAAIQAEINEASTFNQKMGALKKEIEKYEKDLKRINGQTEFLQKVQKERLLSVDLINKMRETVSPKVWLNSINVTDTAIEVKGEAESTNDVNEFNNRLASATYLKDVLTTSSERKVNTTTNFQIWTFNIRASFVDGKQLLDSAGSEAPLIPATEQPAVLPPAAGQVGQ